MMATGTAKEILQSALEKLVSDDFKSPSKNFGEAIGERPIMFRIALYMIKGGAENNGLFVDCDYNRHGDGKKSLKPKSERIEGEKAKRFFPDIVLHMRRCDTHNILVCEIKKKTDPRNEKNDHNRLKLLTKPNGHFEYTIGAFIEVDQQEKCAKIKYFTGGNPETTETWDFTTS